MIIAQNLLGVESTEFVKAFTFIIQFGAILSVVVLYWKRFFQLNHTPAPEGAGCVKRFLHTFDFYWKLFIAFIPAAVLGLLFSDAIDAMLESVGVVAVMLVLGGIFMLFCDSISMIPGVSRSMATIVGGMSQGLTRKAAAEISFFLAVPTMFGATLYKMYKILKTGGVEMITDNMTTLIVGNAVAFIVAMLAIKGFIKYVQKYGFKAFGWYRIIVGGLILVMMAAGFDLQIM